MRQNSSYASAAVPRIRIITMASCGIARRVQHWRLNIDRICRAMVARRSPLPGRQDNHDAFIRNEVDTGLPGRAISARVDRTVADVFRAWLYAEEFVRVG